MHTQMNNCQVSHEKHRKAVQKYADETKKDTTSKMIPVLVARSAI